MKKLGAFIVSHLRVLYLISALTVTVALILIMFPGDFTRNSFDYAEGSFWKEDDLYAPYDFSVVRNQQDNRDEIDRIRAESTPYFVIDSLARSTSRQKLMSVKLSLGQVRIADKVLDYVYSTDGYSVDPISPSVSHVVILNGHVGRECQVKNIVQPYDVVRYIADNMADSADAQILARVLIDSVLTPSIVLDENLTHLELDSRLSQSGFSTRLVQKGDLIVSKGQRIDSETARTIAALEENEQEQRSAEFRPALHYLGLAVLCVVAFVALYIFLKNIQHPLLDDTKKISFAFFVIIFTSAIVALLARVKMEWVLLAPVCMVPILMRIFFDMRVALYIHIVTVIIIGNLVPNSYEFIFYQLVTGIMALVSVRHLEKRSSFFIVSLVIFFTYSLIYTAGVLSQDTSFASINPDRYLIFFFNAILTLLAYPLIFLFERMFGMTTNLTLLEISSTNTPALRELSQKAPGTFQHSIQVANLSEDIINEIGGNSLLAKVGALYHDIGKTAAPLYFTENQNNGFNPHDNLECEESARIITRHVTDGVDLAKKHKLPAEVTDFIRTHHGTTVTGYFYAKAKSTCQDGDFDISAFRYMGPKPFSRETAVVMIVDSVEAACRSLKVHDNTNIGRMIDSIVDDKMKMNQFDNCPLTIQDITQIKRILLNKMMSIYHVRVSYQVVNK